MIIDKKYSHRVQTKTLFVTDNGKPVSNKEITVRQKNHRFLFGCSEFSTVPYVNGELDGEEKELAEKRYEKLFDIFNYITLPFYWGRFEPERGVPITAKTLKTAEFLKAKGITLKGHPLCWHTVTAPWLLDLSDDEILSAQLARIERDVRDFAGLIDIWDVINEVVIMPVFDKYDNGITRICKMLGREELTLKVFNAARKLSPDATLLINDFNTSENYAQLIENLLGKGLKIDAIGIQSHMHQGYWGVEKTQQVLERFSRFGLPLHFTETSLVSGKIMPPEIVDLNDFKSDAWVSTPDGEERQAMETITHYETLFAHPLVHSVTWWSFNDGLWLNAPSGLITKDSHAKPAYNELYKRIKGEWWINQEKHFTNEKGEITVTGCFGDYTASFDDKIIEFSI